MWLYTDEGAGKGHLSSISRSSCTHRVQLIVLKVVNGVVLRGKLLIPSVPLLQEGGRVPASRHADADAGHKARRPSRSVWEIGGGTKCQRLGVVVYKTGPYNLQPLIRLSPPAEASPSDASV